MTDEKGPHGEKVSFDYQTISAKRVTARDDTSAALLTAEERRCEDIERRVNEELWRPWANIMPRCDQPYDFHFCYPLEVAPIEPLIGIVWGDSECDCIESDDTEIVQVIVCNRYSNLVMAHFTINRIVVVKADGSAVPNLPDGSPSVQLVPLGPYCYDDIPPCSCVVRQFTLRLRGAPAGTYRILLQGICFEACFHQLKEECFQFEVCRD
jgi:hypothetical protein